MRSLSLMRSLLLICLSATTGLVWAEDPVVDPPGRVARLSLAEGEVSVAPAGTDEWAEAVVNRPLTSGDRVWVDNHGRAELQVGSATLHLDQGSGVSIIDLDDDVLHLSLTEGSMTIRVLRKRDNESIAIDTPNTTVTLLHPGEYHIEANGEGDQTIVGTRNGESEVINGEKSWRVTANQEGTFKGTSELSANITSLGPRTAFEDWANDRNRQSESPASSRYVSSEVVGYEDLDRHGTWASEPAYGYVWTPSYVAAGWAPYRYGRWVWVSPWGWSWVDNSPWGFAPFHYGRWAYLHSRWCWVPGPRYVRPVYAPALVAWAGGPGYGVSFGTGIGWFPLGPREVYVPGYRYSRGYLHNVNVSNTIIVNNTHITNFYNGRGGRYDYRYGRDPRFVTVVGRDQFVGGRPIDDRWSHVPEPDLRRWQTDPRPPALAPNRDSVYAARVLGRVPGRPDAVRGDTGRPQPVGRSGFTRVPFDVERRAIEANGGRPIGRGQLVATTSHSATPAASGSNEVRDARRTQRDRMTGESGNAVRNDVADSTPGFTTRPQNDRDAVNPRGMSRSFQDRSSPGQPQRDSAQGSNRTEASTEQGLRRQIPEQRQFSREESDSARRARESAARGEPQRNSLQESNSGNSSNWSQRSGQSSQQSRGNDNRLDRVERSDSPRRYDGSRSGSTSAPREQAPPRSISPPATSPQPYRAPREERHLEQTPRTVQPQSQPRTVQPPPQSQPRTVQPQPQSQPRVDSSNSASRPQGNNQSSRQNNSGSRGNESGRPGFKQY
ncbi:MAG TPA: DUF6600 domain-containing protein [Povalibacter sp.]